MGSLLHGNPLNSPSESDYAEIKPKLCLPRWREPESRSRVCQYVVVFISCNGWWFKFQAQMRRPTCLLMPATSEVIACLCQMPAPRLSAKVPSCQEQCQAAPPVADPQANHHWLYARFAQPENLIGLEAAGPLTPPNHSTSGTFSRPLTPHLLPLSWSAHRAIGILSTTPDIPRTQHPPKTGIDN